MITKAWLLGYRVYHANGRLRRTQRFFAIERKQQVQSARDKPAARVTGRLIKRFS